MLLEAILGIIAISVVFCCCTLCCYVLFHYIFTEGGKEDIQPEPEVWEAKHFYDPLPMATPSPPDNIFKPTPYTFKLQNGNGIYSSGLPHAVINPEVLQYPPGHIFDQQRIQPSQPPPAQVKSRHERRINKESSPRRSHSKSKSKSHSRSPSPGRSPRGTQNVWSTNTEFQQPHNYYQNSHRHHHHHQQQHSHPPPQQMSQKQYVQLTQDHYPLQYHRQRQQQQQQYQNMQPQLAEEYYHHQRYDEREQGNKRNPLQRQHSQQFEAFMATTHATNVYTPTSKRKLHRSKSRLKEDVT